MNETLETRIRTARIEVPIEILEALQRGVYPGSGSVVYLPTGEGEIMFDEDDWRDGE